MPWGHPTKTVIVIVSVVWLCVAASARAQQPEHVPPLQQAFMLWQNCYVLHLIGDYEAAAQLFHRSIEAHPTAGPCGHAETEFSKPRQCVR